MQLLRLVQGQVRLGEPLPWGVRDEHGKLLLARGLGSAGVVVASAATAGGRGSPVAQAKSLFPALKNPANRHRSEERRVGKECS